MEGKNLFNEKRGGSWSVFDRHFEVKHLGINLWNYLRNGWADRHPKRVGDCWEQCQCRLPGHRAAAGRWLEAQPWIFKVIHMMYTREGVNIGLKITLVPKVIHLPYLFHWLKMGASLLNFHWLVPNFSTNNFNLQSRRGHVINIMVVYQFFIHCLISNPFILMYVQC